jgi:hypothetical protein
MKAKKLIKQLKKIVDEHGNLPVRFSDDSRVKELMVYDDKGSWPNFTGGEAVEIILY